MRSWCASHLVSSGASAATRCCCRARSTAARERPRRRCCRPPRCCSGWQRSLERLRAAAARWLQSAVGRCCWSALRSLLPPAAWAAGVAAAACQTWVPAPLQTAAAPSRCRAGRSRGWRAVRPPRPMQRPRGWRPAAGRCTASGAGGAWGGGVGCRAVRGVIAALVAPTSPSPLPPSVAVQPAWATRAGGGGGALAHGQRGLGSGVCDVRGKLTKCFQMKGDEPRLRMAMGARCFTRLGLDRRGSGRVGTIGKAGEAWQQSACKTRQNHQTSKIQGGQSSVTGVGGAAGRGKSERLGNRATLAVLSYIKAEGIRLGRGVGIRQEGQGKLGCGRARRGGARRPWPGEMWRSGVRGHGATIGGASSTLARKKG